ncbi:MAG: hypothetical protein H8Z69_05815 [Nanohaloarchaea archaeon]|nr:hypothetical protein [Candidatus Nanohaloarchaea archaeon]
MSKTNRRKRDTILELSNLESGYDEEPRAVSRLFYRMMDVKPVETVGIDLNVLLDPVIDRSRSTDVPLNPTQKQKTNEILGTDYVEEYWYEEDSSIKKTTGALYTINTIDNLSEYFDILYPDTLDKAVEGSKFSQKASDGDTIDTRYSIFKEFLEPRAEPLEVEKELERHELEDDAIYEALSEHDNPVIITYDSDFVTKNRYSDVLALPPEMMERMIENNPGRTGLALKQKYLS